MSPLVDVEPWHGCRSPLIDVNPGVIFLSKAFCSFCFKMATIGFLAKLTICMVQTGSFWRMWNFVKGRKWWKLCLGTETPSPQGTALNSDDGSNCDHGLGQGIGPKQLMQVDARKLTSKNEGAIRRMRKSF